MRVWECVEPGHFGLRTGACATLVAKSVLQGLTERRRSCLLPAGKLTDPMEPAR